MRVTKFIATNFIYLIWFSIYFSWSNFVIQVLLGMDFISATIINLLLYGISLTVAYFFGDAIIGLIEGARPLETKEEKEYLLPLFEEVYQDVQETYSGLPKIRLHIIDTLTVNAMAIGNRTIAVTKGAVQTFDSEELKGIMAHEISHIYYGDTKAIIINTIGNGIATIITLIIKAVLRLLDNFWEGKEGRIFTVIRKILELWVYLMLWVGSIILSINSRMNEFKADKFAHRTGYGEQLTQALYMLQKMSLGQKMKLVQRLTASHPRISKRIGRLEMLADRDMGNSHNIPYTLS